jgi:hypothetical protein
MSNGKYEYMVASLKPIAGWEFNPSTSNRGFFEKIEEDTRKSWEENRKCAARVAAAKVQKRMDHTKVCVDICKEYGYCEEDFNRLKEHLEGLVVDGLMEEPKAKELLKVIHNLTK